MESTPAPQSRSHRGDRTELSDKDLLLGFIEGDMTMFETMVRRYEKPLHGLLYKLTGNRTVAADLFQETFMRVFQKAESFRGNSSFKTWLYTIATNLCRSHWRKKASRDSRPLNGSPEPRSTDPSPSRQVESGEIGERIEEAVSELPAEQKEVFILKIYHEMTYAEIADTVQIPPGTVKSRMRLALQKLRKQLEDIAEAHDVSQNQ
ncbi:MAG: sigma-70 family RNA polymerase sigma factor [Planctomycetes bacterium]|nr:sigma-70 family RNA polymerase sigma factor [Planctomycetota bacterium]